MFYNCIVPLGFQTRGRVISKRAYPLSSRVEEILSWVRPQTQRVKADEYRVLERQLTGAENIHFKEALNLGHAVNLELVPDSLAN